MALITNMGETPDGQFKSIPISGTVFSFKGTISAAGNKTTGWFETSNYDALGFVFLSDKSGNYTIEYSEDKSVLFVPMITVSYAGDDIGFRRKGAVDQDATWCRITWFNDSGASANVSMRVSQKTGLYQPSLETLGAKGAMTRLAQWVKSILHISDSTGEFGDVQRTGNSLNVNVTNPNVVAKTTVGTTVEVTTTATSKVILADNQNRKGATITAKTGTILVTLGTTASGTLYSVRLIPNAYFEVPFGYLGTISAIGAGTVSITELT